MTYGHVVKNRDIYAGTHGLHSLSLGLLALPQTGLDHLVQPGSKSAGDLAARTLFYLSWP